MKKFIEMFVSVIITMILIIGGFAVVAKYVIFHDFAGSPELKNDQKVLGANNSTVVENQKVIIDPQRLESQNDKEIVITSGFVSKNILLFDNTNREYLEGTTAKNSSVELKIGGQKLSTESNPNGIFSFKLPSTIAQFSKGQIVTYSDDLEVIDNFNFIFVLRNYLGRTYFLLQNRGEVFSLEINSDYKTPHEQFPDLVQNDFCAAQLNQEMTAVASKDTLTEKMVIFPSNQTDYNFGIGKFVVFDLANKLQSYDLEYCKKEWMKNESSLAWHTDMIKKAWEVEDLTKVTPSTSPTPTVKVISSPVKI